MRTGELSNIVKAKLKGKELKGGRLGYYALVPNFEDTPWLLGDYNKAVKRAVWAIIKEATKDNHAITRVVIRMVDSFDLNVSAIGTEIRDTNKDELN